MRIDGGTSEKNSFTFSPERLVQTSLQYCKIGICSAFGRFFFDIQFFRSRRRNWPSWLPSPNELTAMETVVMMPASSPKMKSRANSETKAKAFSASVLLFSIAFITKYVLVTYRVPKPMEASHAKPPCVVGSAIALTHPVISTPLGSV